MQRSTTEAVISDVQAHTAALESIIYLERNDFSDLAQIGHRLLTARDGSRHVLFWLDLCSADRFVLLPIHVIKMARTSDFRLDVIKFIEHGKSVKLVHTMNVLAEL